MPSQASRQAPGEPGRAKTKVVPTSPAVARDWMVETPILSKEIRWKMAEKPSIRLVNSGLHGFRRDVAAREAGAARGQDDVDVGIRRIAATAARMASTSSLTMVRPASRWPAAVRRSASVSPERSSRGRACPIP